LNDDLSLSKLPESARAGLRSPRIVTLNAGQVLYRFASTSLAQQLWPAGPWWMHERDYQKIVAEYERSRARHGEDGLTLGYLGRAAMAVKQSWSKMDVVVKARVGHDIKAFAGLGRSQFNEQMPNGIRITWQGWPNVEQLFIPNISDRHGLTSTGHKALLVVGHSFVASQQIF
jgi:hypothetical protein